MKKEYTAPLVEYLEFSVQEMIAEEEVYDKSKPFNDGELGWT